MSTTNSVNQTNSNQNQKPPKTLKEKFWTWVKNHVVDLVMVALVIITAWWVYPSYAVDSDWWRYAAKVATLIITAAICGWVWNGSPKTRVKCIVLIAVTILTHFFIKNTFMKEYRRNQALVAAEEASASKPKSKDWGVKETELVVDTTPRLYTFGHELSKPIPSSEGFPDNVNIEFDVITRGVAYEIYRVDDTGNTELIGRLLPIGHPDRTVLRNIGKIRALQVRLPDGEPAKEAVLWVRTTPK